MLVQCLLLSEALSTVTAAKPLLALMNCLMTFEPCTSNEALSTPLLGTHMFSLESVDSLDVLLEMFVLDVILIAVVVGTFKRPRIGVGIEVVSQPSGAVERLGTSRPRASQSFEVRWKLGPWRRGSSVGGLGGFGLNGRFGGVGSGGIVFRFV